MWALTGLALLGEGPRHDPFDLARPQLRRYGVEDGLPSGTIYGLTWDDHGVLWAATQDGAARFDGKAWTPVHPPGARSTLRSILKDHLGSLWIGGEREGIWHLAGSEWSRYVPEVGINQIVESRTVEPGLWACTRGAGLLRWDGRAWKRETRGLDAAWVWSLKESTGLDGRPCLYLASKNGLWTFEGGTWRRLGKNHRFLDECNGMEQGKDEAGRPVLWVGCWQRGLAQFDGQQWQLFGGKEGLPSVLPTTTLLYDEKAPGGPILWMGTYDRGLVWRQRGRWHTLDAVSKVQVPGVYCILAGRGGKPSLWFGTRYGGVGALDLGGWYSLDQARDLPLVGVSSLAEGPGRLWVGTSRGVTRIEGGVAWPTATVQGAPLSLVNRILSEPDGRGGERLWVSGADGLRCFEQNQWRTIPFPGEPLPIPTYQVLRSRVPGADRVYVATERGLLVGDRSHWEWLLRPPFVGFQEVTALAETLDGEGVPTLWMGTREQGVVRYRQGHPTPMPLSSDGRQVSTNDLKLTRGKDGRTWLWAAFLGEGIGRLEVGQEATGWRLWTQESLPGMPSPSVYNLTFTDRGELYAATSKGMTRLRVQDTPEGPDLREPFVFTDDDGLPITAISYFGTLLDRKGRVWVGSHLGLMVLDPTRESFLQDLPPLMLEGIQTIAGFRPARNGETFRFNVGRFKPVVQWPLTHRRGEARFRTQLVGLESGPGPWVEEPWREFAGLPAMNYQLLVWARNFDGREVGPISWSFEILPPPWATWWARLVYGILLVGGVTLLVRYWILRLQFQKEGLEHQVDERTRELAEAMQNAESARIISEFEREEATTARAEAERANEAKSTFLANMSHEIRTPLNAILGFSDVLRKDPALGPRQQQHLGIIHNSGRALLNLINDILDLSKIEAGHLAVDRAPFSLRGLLHELEQLMRLRASEKGLTLDVVWGRGVPEGLMGDEQKVRQILLNLLSNAVKFTQAGGVTLEASRDARGDLVLEVRDTGPGLSAEEQARLFQPFEQTEAGRKSRQGTGLGLALSWRLAQAMGGELRVTSDLGHGSRFWLSLPGVEGAEVAPAGAPRKPLRVEAVGGPARLLVADDHPPALALYEALLAPLGFRVETVPDGAQAVGRVLEDPPPVVLLDLQMPGMNGFEAARTLRRRWPEGGPFLVACSASVLQHERPKVIEAGFDAFLPKPFQVEAFLELLERSLDWRVTWADPSDQEEPTDPGSGPVGCPLSLRDGFRAALVTGDVDQLGGLVDQLCALEPVLGTRVLKRLQAFDFEGMARILFPLDPLRRIP